MNEILCPLLLRRTAEELRTRFAPRRATVEWIDVTEIGDRYRREIDTQSSRMRGGSEPRFPGDVPVSSWESLKRDRTP
jgi:hypothetical protein